MGSNCVTVLDGKSGTPFEAGRAGGGAGTGTPAADIGASSDVALASVCGGLKRVSNCG